MNYNTLISAETLLQHLNHPNWVLIDCRFSLADSSAGSYAYRHGHLPQAQYADLNQELSSAVQTYTGRHPLPDFNQLAQKLGQWGVSNQSQVVVYDDMGGAFAGRLWWLLRTMGHEKVAVLDGGSTYWQKLAYPMTTVLPKISNKIFRPYLHPQAWVSANDVQNCLAQRSIRLLDARSVERYQGLLEPIDPIAGHIPGAYNRPIQHNLATNGLFLSANCLRQHFKTLLDDKLPENTVHYCGSGITACHNHLAMEYAGLTGSKIYTGSWSEWIRDKNRSVATAKT